jgi:hypothetical protein
VLWFIPPILQQQYQKEGRAIPDPIAGPVLVDTGAHHSCISEKTAKKLGLLPVMTKKTAGLHGAQDSNIYYVGMMLTVGNPQSLAAAKAQPRTMQKIAHMTGVPHLEEASQEYGAMISTATGEKLGFTGLLGRDFLNHIRMTYDGPAGTLRMVADRNIF